MCGEQLEALRPTTHASALYVTRSTYGQEGSPAIYIRFDVMSARLFVSTRES